MATNVSKNIYYNAGAAILNFENPNADSFLEPHINPYLMSRGKVCRLPPLSSFAHNLTEIQHIVVKLTGWQEQLSIHNPELEKSLICKK